MPTSHDRNDNRLLAALSPADRAAVEPFLRPVDLPNGEVLYEPGEPITFAYFPVQGVVSLVSDMEQGTVEVGTIGREGMLGVPILLHTDTVTTRAFMQVPGHGWRCTAADLLRVTTEVPAFSRLLHRYVQMLFDQVAQSVACNRLHSLEERCARWLLMVHDRVDDDLLPLKQTFLADMLGVHRPAVTLAAGALQTAGLIRYSRGKVQVLDRPGLEAASCQCYGIVRERFRQQLRSESMVG
jgi:CRP-like cAMP-binding protein